MSTYTPIASLTLSASTSSVTFSNIPQTYTDLVLVMDATATTNFTNTKIVINSDSGTNYSWTNLKGDGSSASSAQGSSTANLYLGLVNTGRGTYKFMFQNYSNSTTNKTILSAGGLAGNREEYAVGLWRNTNAVTSIEVIQPADTFSSGSTFNLYGISSSDGITPKATGGNQVYSDGTNWIHIFTSSGTFTPSESLSNVDYLVIAGGGGGGNGHGGGGGAGGYRTSAGTSGANSAAESKLSLTNQTYTITVGSGGAANSQGVNSSITANATTIISSSGGGYGGAETNPGISGGSGGGGNPGGSGTANQGLAGGSTTGSGTNREGGGGGGASAAGNTPGGGGAGLSSSITGTSITRAGGGGGGKWLESGSPYSGGSGGGGNGAWGNETQGGTDIAAKTGTANTGGGGGGGAGGSVGEGAAGGSGIVVIRYAV
jgi:hypothetical protein